MADKQAPQGVEAFQYHWSTFFSLFCISLWDLVIYLPTLKFLSLHFWFFLGLFYWWCGFFCLVWFGGGCFVLGVFFFPVFLSFLFSFMRNLPNISLFLLWSHLPSSIPWVRGCCHSLLHVTHPGNAGISLLEVDSTAQLQTRAACSSPGSVFLTEFQSPAELQRAVLRDDNSHADSSSLKSFLYSPWRKELVKAGGKAVYQGFFPSLNIAQWLWNHRPVCKGGVQPRWEVQIQMAAGWQWQGRRWSIVRSWQAGTKSCKLLGEWVMRTGLEQRCPSG